MIWTVVGKFVVFCIIVAVGYAIGIWARDMAKGAMQKLKLDPLAERLLVNMVQPVVVLIAAYAALSYLHVDLTPAVAVLGAAGLAVALALRNSLSGVAAGAVLLTIRPYDGEDFVEVAGQSGNVVEFDLLTITLKSVDGTLLTLPNELVLQNPIRNFTRNGLLRLSIDVWVDHGANLDKANATLLATMAADDRVLDEPKPTVTVQELALEGTKLQVTGWVKTAAQVQARSDVMANIDKALKKAKIARARRPVVATS